jgi:uncharacterized protein
VFLTIPWGLWALVPGGEAILRITQFCLIWVCVWLPFGLPMSFRFQWIPFKPLKPQQKLILLLPLYAIAVPVFVIWVHQQGGLLSNYGFVLQAHFLSAGLLGVGIGLLSFAILIVCEYALGWVSIRGYPDRLPPDGSSSQKESHLPVKMGQIATLLGLLLLALAISFVEELLFRGFLWAELRPTLTLLGGAIVSSCIFAVLHLIWDGWSARSQLFGLTLMGLALCVARWVDHDQLGLAWGLHAGWVWAIASLDAFQSLEFSPTAPLWLVGKPGQPLTGGLTLICLGIVTALMLLNYFYRH